MWKIWKKGFNKKMRFNFQSLWLKKFRKRSSRLKSSRLKKSPHLNSAGLLNLKISKLKVSNHTQPHWQALSYNWPMIMEVRRIKNRQLLKMVVPLIKTKNSLHNLKWWNMKSLKSPLKIILSKTLLGYRVLQSLFQVILTLVTWQM